jgi:hypothetical protein
VLRAVVEAIWFESARPRDAIHRLNRVRACDLLLRIGDRSVLLAGECQCRDFLTDMIVEADRFLLRRPAAALRNPPGAVRIHVRRRTEEWRRRRRVERGAQARTDRLRGSVIAARLPDDYHRALFEYLAEEAGSLAPLGSESGLHRRLAELLAAEFGGGADDHLARVETGVVTVEAACRDARRVRPRDGSGEPVSWWVRFVEEPLGRRPRLDGVQLDALSADGRPALVERFEHLADEPDPAAVAVTIVMRIVADAQSAGIPAGLRAAAAELVRRRLLSAAAAERFVADPQRLSDAADQVRALQVAA